MLFPRATGAGESRYPTRKRRAADSDLDLTFSSSCSLPIPQLVFSEHGHQIDRNHPNIGERDPGEGSSRQVFGNRPTQSETSINNSTVLDIYKYPPSSIPSRGSLCTSRGSIGEDEDLEDENGPNPGEIELIGTEMKNMSESSPNFWALTAD